MTDENKIPNFAEIPELVLEDFNKNVMGGMYEVSGMDALAIGVAWTALGVLMANLESHTIPWLALLGWPIMILGLLCVLFGAVVVHRQKGK